VITPLQDFARWSLRLPPAAAERLRELAGFPIAIEINRCACANDRIAARLGPDEWLLCAPADVRIEDPLGAEHHALVDVAHRYVGFVIEGAQAPVLLAAGCPLDLHPKVFTAGTATRTLLGKAEIVLWRLHEAPAYRVECPRSFAPYVMAFLREAARELT
jgi:sarcosine oxidase, subunit gamma